MKKMFFLVLLSCCSLFSVTLSAQQAKGVIKVNPIGLAFGNFNATYEIPLNAKTSIGIGANYYFKLLGLDVSGFGIGGEYRYYITNKTNESPEGFYIGPSAGFSYASVSGGDYSGGTIGVGAIVGYQWLWDSGFVLDLGIGPQYTIALAKNEFYDFSGFLPRINLAIGFAFKD